MITLETKKPQQLPFLEAICWQTDRIRHFTEDEMLDRYERGWGYIDVLEGLKGEERKYVARIAKTKGSWLVNEL
jgi:hypothetical protein